MDQYDDIYDSILEATDDVDEIYEALSDRQRIALELALEIVQDESSGSAGVTRVQEIFKDSDAAAAINTLIPQIYGETLLSNALGHSASIVKALIDAGADPTVENMMDGDTPIDALLDISEDERTEDVKEMIRILKGKGTTKSPSVEEELEDLAREKQREMMWACEMDPDEVDPDNLTPMQSVFLRMATKELADDSPEEIAYRAGYNEKMSNAKRQYDTLPKGARKLMDEAFHILDLDDDEYPYYESPEQALARIRAIFGPGSEKDLNVNLLSYKEGEGLLFRAVSNPCFAYDEKEEIQVELVKFLLQEKGADPNIENVMDRTTALDWIDDSYGGGDLDDMTPSMMEAERLLMEAGAKVLPRDDMGKIIGERGEGEGWLATARREKAEEAATDASASSYS